ncbi:MAG: DUF2937 family protein [Pseudidiomarina maritima]|nr:DUF2937 family protein [Pseudidiomarina maritima]
MTQPFFMLRRYFSLLLALTAALVGVQIPNYVTQYQQRIDAQYTEAMIYYREYQAIADTYLNGDMQALLAAHENSDNDIFKAEAVPLRTLIDRVELLSYEQQQLQRALPVQVWFIATQANPQIRQDTWRMYSYNVPMTTTAVVTALVSAVLTLLLWDACWGLLGWGWRRVRGTHKGRRVTP